MISGVFPQGHRSQAVIKEGKSLLDPTSEVANATVTEFINPLSQDPASMSALEQMKKDWSTLFPGATDREKLMFLYGVIAMCETGQLMIAKHPDADPLFVAETAAHYLVTCFY